MRNSYMNRLKNGVVDKSDTSSLRKIKPIEQRLKDSMIDNSTDNFCLSLHGQNNP